MLSIVNYHYIRENFNTKYPSIFGVTKQQFKKQLLLLKNQGDFITTYDFNNNYNSILKSKENYYLITFDDGLKEQYTKGYSVLQELNLQGFFFLNALNFKEKKVSLVHKIHLLRSEIDPQKILNHIKLITNSTLSLSQKKRSHNVYRFDDKNSAELKFLLNYVLSYRLKEEIINDLFLNFFDEKKIVEELYLNNKQIKELSKFEMIGNHTYNHKNLGVLNEKELLFEIETSKKILENICGKEITTISYPYGSKEVYNDKVLNVVKKSNHKFGFTTTKGVNLDSNNLLTLKRFDCNDLIGGKNYEG